MPVEEHGGCPWASCSACLPVFQLPGGLCLALCFFESPGSTMRTGALESLLQHSRRAGAVPRVLSAAGQKLQLEQQALSWEQ